MKCWKSSSVLPSKWTESDFFFNRELCQQERYTHILPGWNDVFWGLCCSILPWTPACVRGQLCGKCNWAAKCCTQLWLYWELWVRKSLLLVIHTFVVMMWSFDMSTWNMKQCTWSLQNWFISSNVSLGVWLMPRSLAPSQDLCSALQMTNYSSW